ncbi:hypothetical protein [Marinobacter sp.]|uniref:hypothetical protein n=1 Tax=Marinobacter sp. TaxID=50741 RepID=UPI003A8F6364
MIKCLVCDQEAERVLVTYMHEIVGEGAFFCERHAFDDGRERCPYCDDYGVEVEDEDSGEIVELLPTYPAGALDSEDSCSEHP